MDQREPGGRAALDLADRLLPGLEVELGWRARRHDEASALEADACGVAGVQRSVRVEARDVVPRMTGSRKALEADHAVADDVDVLGRDRRELAPELVERIAVESARARVELRRIDEVRSSDLRDVHLQIEGSRDEHPGCACVVEVDVRGRRCRTSVRARGRARRGRPSRPVMHVVGPQSKSAGPSSVSSR